MGIISLAAMTLVAKTNQFFDGTFHGFHWFSSPLKVFFSKGIFSLQRLKVNLNEGSYPVGIFISYYAASFAANTMAAQLTEVRFDSGGNFSPEKK